MGDVADAVVIGSGGFGASVAYHLARRGLAVALLDRHAMASQTSPRAAGIAATIRATDLMTRLANRAVAMIHELAEDLHHPLGVVRSGSVKLARTEEDLVVLERNEEMSRRYALCAEWIDPARVPELNPIVRADGVIAALHIPTDLYFEPQELAIAYVGGAAKHGARLLPHRGVTAIKRDRGRVCGVETTSEPIEAPIVIDAAGAWAGEIARGVGCAVPMVPVRHQLLITEPLDGIEPEHAIVRVLDAAVYGRPAWGGFLIGGYEPDPLLVDAASMPPTQEARDTPLDLGVLRRLIDLVAATMPALVDAPVRVHRGGLPTMTVDGQHLVGPVPDADGMWIAAGCNVSGLSISPVIGELLAEWIVEGEPSEDLSALAITRFGPEWASEEAVRAAAAERYRSFFRATI